MSVALIIITDGRDDYLARCVTSAEEHLTGPITERWMFDDTGNDAYRTRLKRRYPDWHHIDGGPRQGFGGAIRAAWSHLVARSQADWVFHLEGDFTFVRDVDLADLIAVMADRPDLVQLAFRRQAWSAAERAAGGVVEANPGAYHEHRDRTGRVWLTHRLFFTTNPCLYRRSLCQEGWPDGPESEGRFTHHLLMSGDVWFGYWGARSSGEWVKHIGQTRAGHGY